MTPSAESSGLQCSVHDVMAADLNDSINDLLFVNLFRFGAI